MPNKNYELDAHSKNFHGPSGKAVGAKQDLGGGPVLNYAQPTNEEKGVVVAQDTGGAAHHPNFSTKAHQFPKPPAPGAHGFGHPAHTRSGPLRNSGHRGAHRVGKR
jgi:hypothetical protein